MYHPSTIPPTTTTAPPTPIPAPAPADIPPEEFGFVIAVEVAVEVEVVANVEVGTEVDDRVENEVVTLDPGVVAGIRKIEVLSTVHQVGEAAVETENSPLAAILTFPLFGST